MVRPGGVKIREGFDPKAPKTGFLRARGAVPAIIYFRTKPMALTFFAFRVKKHRFDANQVVPFAKDRC